VGDQDVHLHEGHVPRQSTQNGDRRSQGGVPLAR